MERFALSCDSPRRVEQVTVNVYEKPRACKRCGITKPARMFDEEYHPSRAVMHGIPRKKVCRECEGGNGR